MLDLEIINDHVLDGLCRIPDESVQCIVTSPPYWGLRDYGVKGQIGLERTPEEYVATMVKVFASARRVLRDDGVLWLNLGDSYSMNTKWAGGDGKQHTNAGGVHASRSWVIPCGLKPKDLVGIPWRVAFALQANGWYLRSDVIWAKPNPMPESVTDRPTKAHEYVFLMTKAARYYYDAESISGVSTTNDPRRPYTSEGAWHIDGRPLSQRHGGERREQFGRRNARTVWTIPTEPYPEAHFATFPTALAERCIRAGSRPGDTVLDPFAGSGTTLAVARGLGRSAIGIEINPEYVKLIEKRCSLPWEKAQEPDNGEQPSLFGG